MYQINGFDRVLAYLADEPDPEKRTLVLAFFPVLAGDPEGIEGIRRPGPAPTYFVTVPETTVVITYTVIDQYRTVLVQRIEDIPKAIIDSTS